MRCFIVPLNNIGKRSLVIGFSREDGSEWDGEVSKYNYSLISNGKKTVSRMKFSESIALLRGWVEIIVTKTLEFLEMKIYSPLSVEKIEENL